MARDLQSASASMTADADEHGKISESALSHFIAALTPPPASQPLKASTTPSPFTPNDEMYNTKFPDAPYTENPGNVDYSLVLAQEGDQWDFATNAQSKTWTFSILIAITNSIQTHLLLTPTITHDKSSLSPMITCGQSSLTIDHFWSTDGTNVRSLLKTRTPEQTAAIFKLHLEIEHCFFLPCSMYINQ